MNFKNIKISSLLIVIIFIFFIIAFIGYKILLLNIHTNYEKDTKILFYKIKSDTNDLLTQLLYQRNIQTKELLEKHKIVKEYLKDKNKLNVDLQYIYTIINKNREDNPYNIYITNKNLVIKNTTYKPDFNFDLSFAKSTFDKRYEQNIVRCSNPYFKKTHQKFFSFTDSYFIENGEKDGILQISYRYSDIDNLYEKIQILLKNNLKIKDVKAFVEGSFGYMSKITFSDFDKYKNSIEDMKKDILSGNSIKTQLNSQEFYQKYLIIDGKKYTSLFIVTRSTLFQNKIYYTLLLDTSDLEKKKNDLDVLITILTLLGLISIIVNVKVRDKESRLDHQDKFVQSSMHEIGTPLSIITLNNELREEIYGADEYSSEIESALKTLQNSYDDMSFIVTQNTQEYPKELLKLQEIVQIRVHYFDSIAKSNDIIIESSFSSNCIVKISLVELERLIDNNLSNSIKYSKKNSIVKVILKNNILTFKNYGNKIDDTDKIFKKYFRENSIVGGYGLGLSIVKDISSKYGINISVQSDDENGTIFSYEFKSHI